MSRIVQMDEENRYTVELKKKLLTAVFLFHIEQVSKVGRSNGPLNIKTRTKGLGLRL